MQEKIFLVFILFFEQLTGSESDEYADSHSELLLSHVLPLLPLASSESKDDHKDVDL